MTTDQALSLLTEHRNGLQEYAYQDRKEAMGAIKHLVTEWIQRVDGHWQLVIIGYHD
jgi:hypothetical protein